MNRLRMLGIYEEAINSAIESCEEALMNTLIEDHINTLHNSIGECLKETGSWDDITNSIIYAYFSTTKALIEEFSSLEVDIDFYINGSDSHFYVNEEEM